MRGLESLRGDRFSVLGQPHTVHLPLEEEVLILSSCTPELSLPVRHKSFRTAKTQTYFVFMVRVFKD